MSIYTVTADVVVVGAGPAGMAAASSACRSGASVLVLESGNRVGGNAIRSNGYLAFVGRSGEHRAAFLDDARAAYVRASERYGLVWDEAAVRQFAVESAETQRILTRRGVRFNRTVARPEHSVDRIHAVADPAMFARAYAGDFTRPTVRTEFGVRADRLLVVNGRVTGISAHRLDGGDGVVARAGRAVVLATGGYQAGHQLRARHQPFAAALSPYHGTPDCRGDGHVMGGAIGGDLVNMAYLPPTVIAASTVVEQSVAINADAVRFHDETGSFTGRVEALRREGGRAWYILDERDAREQARLIEQMPQPPVRAAGVADLARALGVDADRLAGTVAEWNAFLASGDGADPRFGRTGLPRRRRPLGARLVAIPMVEGVNISCGGFRTTADMQVIDVFGSAIPGLFAAGDTNAGLNAAAGMGGLHISGAFTQGRIAGQAAAADRLDTADYGGLLGATSPAVAAAERFTGRGMAVNRR